MSNEVSDGGLSEEDRKRVAEIAKLMNELVIVLKAVMPEASGDEVGTLAHNLADYWDICRHQHDRVSKILTMRGPGDRKVLADELADLIYGDIDGELPYHLESMRETLPKIIERLEQ